MPERLDQENGVGSHHSGLHMLLQMSESSGVPSLKANSPLPISLGRL